MSTTTEENDDDEITIESSRAFTEALVEQVNKEDVQSMVELQKDMLSRFEKTNEMLINFNMLSSARCEATTQEFRKHTLVLGQMKADLDVVFRRIRSLKQRLGTLYPEAFAACSDVYNILENSEEEEEKEEGAKKVRSSVEISVTDTTKSEQHSQVAKHCVKDPNVKIVQNDEAAPSDEFAASSDVKQSDHVPYDCGVISSEVPLSSERDSSPSIISDAIDDNTKALSNGPKNIDGKEHTI